VHSVLTDNLAQTVVCSIVASRLNYCNAVLYGASPAATFDVLQRVQNNLARVVCQNRGRAAARPLLKPLHWLPIMQRVTYMIDTVTFKVMSSSTPAYLSELMGTAAPARPLWSSDAPLSVSVSVCQECELNLFDEHSWSQHHRLGTPCPLTLDLVIPCRLSNVPSQNPPVPTLLAGATSASVSSKDIMALYKCCIIIIIIDIHLQQ